MTEIDTVRKTTLSLFNEILENFERIKNDINSENLIDIIRARVYLVAMMAEMMCGALSPEKIKQNFIDLFGDNIEKKTDV